MDITFRAGNEKFNYRVCAVMIDDNKILAMHDERSPYFYPLFLKDEIFNLPQEFTIRTENE